MAKVKVKGGPEGRTEWVEGIDASERVATGEWEYADYEDGELPEAFADAMTRPTHEKMQAAVANAPIEEAKALLRAAGTTGTVFPPLVDKEDVGEAKARLVKTQADVRQLQAEKDEGKARSSSQQKDQGKAQASSQSSGQQQSQDKK